MGEKIEIRDERGTIIISHTVIAEIAAMACLESPGVAAMSAAAGAAEKGVKGVVFTQDEDGSGVIDAHILVKINAVVSETAEAAQLAIKNAVESSAGIDVSKVNVFVAGIALK